MATELFTVRIDHKLKKEAQEMAEEQFGIGLGTLTKLFFVSFVKQPNIHFYVGDKEFDKKLGEMLKLKKVKAALKKLGNAL